MYGAVKSIRWGYTAGVVGVLAAALCGRSVGILVRLVEHADGWQVLFFRSVSFALTVFLFMMLQDGRRVGKRFLSVGPLGIVVAVFLGSAFIDMMPATCLAGVFVPVAEITLLMLLEVVAAPIWAWIGVGEVPAYLTLAGGTIVLIAVVVQAVWGSNQNQ